MRLRAVTSHKTTTHTSSFLVLPYVGWKSHSLTCTHAPLILVQPRNTQPVGPVRSGEPLTESIIKHKKQLYPMAVTSISRRNTDNDPYLKRNLVYVIQYLTDLCLSKSQLSEPTLSL